MVVALAVTLAIALAVVLTVALTVALVVALAIVWTQKYLPLPTHVNSDFIRYAIVF